jgi:inner membrane protein
MDSLTQIVLGAAVGEVVLGKKIGNRAIIWGAIGGTIPDLDVLANLFMSELNALSVHRGITHSIFFSVVAPVAFAWLLSYLYRSGAYRSALYKYVVAGINVTILALITWGVYRASDSLAVLGLAGSFSLYLIWRLFRYYLKRDLKDVDASFKEWYLLFFLAFFTHFSLDCFTAYGTQIFLPFSNLRVAFNTISVVDPAYTLPFLICVIIVALLRRGSRVRSVVNWLGIGLSSAYMLFTVFNRQHVDGVFSRALESRNIDVDRQRVGPVILQNVLWSCVAESDEAFYIGLYSLFDSNPYMHWINVLPKNKDAIQILEPSPEYQTLRWFSDGYLQVADRDTTYELFDLRFGMMTDTITNESDFVFRFVLHPAGDEMEFSQVRNGQMRIGETFSNLVKRAKGR